MKSREISIGCIIMASGQGKRFGSNKLMADFLGEPLIASVLKTTDKLFDKRIVVTRHENVADYCKRGQVEFIFHQFPLQNDTVRLGIEHLEEMTHCMFVMGDQPLISRESLLRIIEAIKKAPDYIWRFAYEDTPGAPVVFPGKYFSELKTLPEGKGGGVLLKKYADRVRSVPVMALKELLDVDTQEDLKEIIALKEQ